MAGANLSPNIQLPIALTYTQQPPKHQAALGAGSTTLHTPSCRGACAAAQKAPGRVVLVQVFNQCALVRDVVGAGNPGGPLGLPPPQAACLARSS
jgi:hypothetical protein